MATYYMWTGSGVTARANSTAYTAGARVVIALGDVSTNYLVVRRYVLECTTGGTSGAAVPAWSASYTPDTSTIADGTVTWTVRNPGYSSGTTVNWSFATIYFDYLIRACNAANDVGLIHYTSTDNLTVDTTYDATTNTRFISVDKDSSSAPTAMGTTGYIGNTTGTSVAITLRGTKVYFYGITFRTGSTNTRNLTFGDTNNDHLELEKCYFYWATSSTTARLITGADNADIASYVRFIDCTFRFGSTSAGFDIRTASTIFEGGSVDSAGSRPSILFVSASGRPSTDVYVLGMDLSYITGTLCLNSTAESKVFRFQQCKLGSGVTPLATQTNASKASCSAWLYDCASGDTHTFMGYYDAFGSCVSDSTIYYTTGAAAQSWKIVTTANCSYYTPFVSPFVDWYNTGTTSITPYIEILRDGSTTAFQDDEVWGEFFVKTTSGSTQSTEYSDRMALLGTPANQAAGAGTGSWTGEAASAWSGKVDSGSAVTPAEAGAIRGRVVVGEPSITVYVDPQIRT